MKTKIWGHRGASGYAPENTLEAFSLALSQGADGIELDVQLTKDGELVIIHDEWIDRTSNGKGWVKDLTLEELRSYDFNNHMEGFKDVKIPTLAEVYDLFANTGKTINVEVKTGIVFYENIEEKLLALAKEKGMEDQIIYSSFNHQTMKNVKALKPDAVCGFLYSDGTLAMDEYCEKHGMDALHPALFNLQYPGFLENCKKKQIPLHVWTVNEEAHMQMCFMYGIDAMITNYPDKARSLRDR